mmetsp:Transcript_71144/g.139769  ORF Transcript_71144/g.139769 Transcript_71144/m.139769 type:complete len:98 (-) Transcript_71144:38-331(-)
MQSRPCSQDVHSRRGAPIPPSPPGPSDFMPARRTNTEQGGGDSPTPLLSHPQVFKAAEDATPPGRENLELDFTSEVVENNIDARSDHGVEKRRTSNH